MNNMSTLLVMKLAITADWFTVFGGAEHVLAECAVLWPDAPFFTTVARPERLGPLCTRHIHVTGLQTWYRLLRTHQVLLPWMPRAIESIDLTGFDVILSSSHAVAKGIVPPSSAVHVCYCHTPMRYAWEMEDQYLKDFRVPFFLRRILKNKLRALRRWDLTTAKRVDVFIANSTETQQRIKRIYERDSVVLPPPVNDKFLQSPLVPVKERAGYIAIGRLVPYKRFDVLIEAANRLPFPLQIAGIGSEESRLKSIAGPTVTFLGFVSDADLPSLYANAKALLFPQDEDAGIVPLEAQACGTPVIAYGKGGALDSIIDTKTGIFFADQTVESLCNAIAQFETMTFKPESIRKHAEQFSAARFRETLKEIIEKAVQSHQKK